VREISIDSEPMGIRWGDSPNSDCSLSQTKKYEVGDAIADVNT
jgi:hypothetical protein